MASNSVVDMCGHAYLYRREERRRWLLLTGDTLFVFADLPQFTPVASLDLRCARLVATSTPHELQLHTAGRDYHLRASDEATCADWRARWRAAAAVPPRRRWAGSRSAARATRSSTAVLRARPRRACSRTFAGFEPRRCPRDPARQRTAAASRDVKGGRRRPASCWRPPKAPSSWVPRASRSATSGSSYCLMPPMGCKVRRPPGFNWARRQQRWRRGGGVGASDGRASGLPRGGVISSFRKNSSGRPSWYWAASTAA